MNKEQDRPFLLFCIGEYIFLNVLFHVIVSIVLNGLVYKWVNSSIFYPSLPFLFNEVKLLVLNILLLIGSLLNSFIVLFLLMRNQEYFRTYNWVNRIRVKVVAVYVTVFAFTALLCSMIIAPWVHWEFYEIGGRSIIFVLSDAIVNVLSSEPLFLVEIHENGTLKTTTFLFFIIVLSSYIIATASMYLGALLEELLFRGPMFLYFKDKAGLKVSVVTTSILFSLVHVSYHVRVYYITVYIFTFFFSVLLSYFFLKTRNIFFTTTLHFTWNLVVNVFGGTDPPALLMKKFNFGDDLIFLFNVYSTFNLLFAIVLLFAFARFYNSLPLNLRE